MDVIFLIGARASGKTSVGRELSERLGWEFYDLDQCLSDFHGRTVAEIVAESGWEEFRRLESENLRRVTAGIIGNAVIATGGGIILAEENRNFMQKHGKVIWLRVPEQILHERLAADPLVSQRPSLTGQGLLEEIREILARREPLYAACAQQTVAGDSKPGEICKAIEELLMDKYDGQV